MHLLLNFLSTITRQKVRIIQFIIFCLLQGLRNVEMVAFGDVDLGRNSLVIHSDSGMRRHIRIRMGVEVHFLAGASVLVFVSTIYP